MKIPQKVSFKIIFKHPFDSRYNEDKIDFVHTYTFINQGPSYTNEDKIVKLYFAKSEFTNLKDIAGCEKEDDVSVKNMDNPVPSEENPIGCANGLCIIFQCTIPKYWKKDEDYEFVLEAEFHPESVKGLEHTEFSIYSMASISEKTKTHAMTKMSSSAQGAIKRLAANWPIVLGVGIGLFVVFGTIIILWKTGILAKMRPYKLDEDEVKAEHRKSQMRMSVRYSVQPNPIG